MLMALYITSQVHLRRARDSESQRERPISDPPTNGIEGGAKNFRHQRRKSMPPLRLNDDLSRFASSQRGKKQYSIQCAELVTHLLAKTIHLLKLY